MTTLRTAVTGDSGDVRIIQLAGIADLTGAATVAIHIWRSGLAPKVLVGAIQSIEEASISFNLGGVGGWLATEAWAPKDGLPITYNIEYQVTYTSGDVVTWPDEGPDTLPVRRQGA